MVRRWFAPLLARQDSSGWQDHKTELQELSQACYRQSPTYHLLEATGPSHAKKFLVEIRLGKTALAQGEGPSKKKAEQQAARLALMKFREEKSGAGS